MRPALALIVLLATFVGTAAAHAAGPAAVVIRPDGKSVPLANASPLLFPSDGSLVDVESLAEAPNDLTLQNVQLLGGQFQLMQLDVLGDGKLLYGDAIIGGRVVQKIAPNTLVPVPGVGYVVVDQSAKASGHLGRVALRLVVTSDQPGAPKGTQVLIGVPTDPVAAGTPVQRPAFNPLAALGFSAGVAQALAFSAAPAVTGGSIGERAVAIAEQYLGVPYVWGGAAPIPGFDCSGLALFVYAQLGVTLTHYTGAQFQEGLPIARADLEPGDLVFFDADPVAGPQHEGIYIGDGRFIQAPHTGDVVKISSLDDPAYGLSYVGAVRPYVR